MVGYYVNGQMIRSWLTLISMAIRPFSFIFLLTVIGGVRFLPAALIGGLVSFAIGSGYGQLPVELAGLTKRSKFKYILVSSPVHPLTFMLGTAIGLSLPSLPHIVVILALLLYLGYLSPVQLPLFLGTLLLLWTWSVATGFYLSTKIREPIRLIRVASLVDVLFLVLPPVYYPLELLPQSLQIPMLILPTSGAAALLRSFTDSSQSIISMREQIIALLSLLAILLVSLAFVARWSEWREKGH